MSGSNLLRPVLALCLAFNGRKLQDLLQAVQVTAPTQPPNSNKSQISLPKDLSLDSRLKWTLSYFQLERFRRHTHKGHRQNLLKVRVFSGYFQGVLSGSSFQATSVDLGVRRRKHAPEKHRWAKAPIANR